MTVVDRPVAHLRPASSSSLVFCRGPGAAALLASWGITLYTLWLLIQLHECVPGVRFDRLRDLGAHALGPRLGPWVVVPQQLIVQLGCDMVYMVTGGSCLQKFAESACPTCAPLHRSYWICIFGSSQFLLSQLPNLDAITAVSFLAAAMSLRYGNDRPARSHARAHTHRRLEMLIDLNGARGVARGAATRPSRGRRAWRAAP